MFASLLGWLIAPFIVAAAVVLTPIYLIYHGFAGLFEEVSRWSLAFTFLCAFAMALAALHFLRTKQFGLLKMLGIFSVMPAGCYASFWGTGIFYGDTARNLPGAYELMSQAAVMSAILVIAMGVYAAWEIKSAWRKPKA